MIPDWSILEMEGVLEVCDRVATKVSKDYYSTIEYDDALQELYLILASQARMWRKVINAYGLGILHHRLKCDLIDKVKGEAKRRSTHRSYEQGMELALE